MTIMGIREVTRNTSKMIHRAAAGETVVITEHDRPIAMLVPLPSTGDPAVDELIRDGVLTPASNPGGIAALLAVTPVEGDGDAGQAIADQREERL
ncbi:MAG TPA: hypothetical protein VGP16_26395 [Asanoa sp.]|jgi:antitoxin (DNA-binding transcriptional repressor) of toxin-antitoxin stability system|nr:hypothetical protein [Asanoa sp.]